jgi:hypothetical protein
MNGGALKVGVVENQLVNICIVFAFIGPSSVALDVSFHEFEHLYGIPLHASSMSLKSTR